MEKDGKMQKVFNKLRSLQEVLLKEFEIEAELEEIPKELDELKRNFQKVERIIKENEKNIESLNEKMSYLKKEKAELQKNHEKYEGQISLIKTQREYEAITSEIAQIKEKLENIEEEEMNSLGETEDMKKVIEEQSELHVQLKSTIAEKEKEVHKLQSEKKKELDKCLKEKHKISSGLDEEVIYKFEKIVKNKEGIGIVSIRRGVCMGCNMILPPQFINDVRREEEIIFCPNCSRILYFFEESPEEEEELVLE
jgi:predicted  nucleic acid-binding Zn-ribbon protein